MTAKLVRFIRSHADDDEHVAMRFGPYPGVEAYFQQLRDELEEGSLVCSDNLELVYGEMRIAGINDKDAYALYVRVPSFDAETPRELANRIQDAYDEGAASGWFQVIAP